MDNILSQSEVDALLSAYGEGTMPPAAPPRPATAEGAAPYDWKRPERVSKDQMRSLENLHEVLARNLGAGLSAYLRTLVDVKLASVEQLTYSEFILSLPNPTCFSVLSVQPLEGEAVLEINPSIVFPLIDRILGGGKGASPPMDRPLTDLEVGILRRVLPQILEQFRAVWARVRPLAFVLRETESNPQLRQIVPPNEVVVLIAFEIAMGEASGSMNLCIPFRILEPAMPSFAIQNLFTLPRGGAASHAASIREALLDSSLEGVATLAETAITPRELLDLKVGDVLQTPKRSDSPALLCLAGRPKLRAAPMLSRGKRALRILGPAGPHEHL